MCLVKDVKHFYFVKVLSDSIMMKSTSIFELDIYSILSINIQNKLLTYNTIDLLSYFKTSNYTLNCKIIPILDLDNSFYIENRVTEENVRTNRCSTFAIELMHYFINYAAKNRKSTYFMKWISSRIKFDKWCQRKLLFWIFICILLIE